MIGKFEEIDRLTAMMELMMNNVEAAASLSAKARGEVCDLLHGACIVLDRSKLVN